MVETCRGYKQVEISGRVRRLRCSYISSRKASSTISFHLPAEERNRLSLSSRDIGRRVSMVMLISVPSARSISSSGSMTPFRYLALTVFNNATHLQDSLFLGRRSSLHLPIIILSAGTAETEAITLASNTTLSISFSCCLNCFLNISFISIIHVTIDLSSFSP